MGAMVEMSTEQNTYWFNNPTISTRSRKGKKKSQCSCSISDGDKSQQSKQYENWGVPNQTRPSNLDILEYLCSRLEEQKQLPVIPSSTNPFLNVLHPLHWCKRVEKWYVIDTGEKQRLFYSLKVPMLLTADLHGLHILPHWNLTISSILINVMKFS